jgi:hypothetical protein
MGIPGGSSAVAESGVNDLRIPSPTQGQPAAEGGGEVGR